MTSRLAQIGLLCLLPILGAAQQAGPLPPILKKHLDSLNQARYEGQRVSESRIDGKWIRNQERVLADRSNLRIEFSPDSANAGQIILFTGGKRYHIFLKERQANLTSAHKDEFLGRAMRFLHGGAKNSLAQMNGGQVAGRATELVSVQNPEGKPMLKLWIDSATGVLLKREAFDPRGERLAAMEFQRINFSPRFTKRDFEIDTRNLEVITPLDRVKRLSEAEGLPAFILKAPGLELEAARSLEVAGKKALLQMYSGKETRVSLFVMKGEPQMPGRGKRGNMRRYSWKVGTITLTLVGNQSESELRTLAGMVGSP